MHGALLTCSRAVFGTVGPARGLCEAQLPAEDVGSLKGEVVIADGAPLASSLDLHAALEGLPGEAGQPEPQPLAASPVLGGRGRGWRPQAGAAQQGQQQPPWAPWAGSDMSHGREGLGAPERECVRESETKPGLGRRERSGEEQNPEKDRDKRPCERKPETQGLSEKETQTQ